jgi:uncharacterized protein (TIGR02145 family)
MNKKMFFSQNISSVQKCYGYLYNAYAASHANFAPSGWHIPTVAEFSALITEIGGSSSGGELKEAGLDHWYSPNTNADNSSGFNAYGGGLRNSAFSFLKENGKWWSGSTGATSNYHLLLNYDNGDAFTGMISSGNLTGMSIRLIKNDSTDPGTMTDYDGNTYDTVKIGDQVWTVQNWKCTKLNDGTALTKVTSQTTWNAAGASNYYYCAYDNNENNV